MYILTNAKGYNNIQIKNKGRLASEVANGDDKMDAAWIFSL